MTTLSSSDKKHLEKENLAEQYSLDNPLSPQYKVFHVNDTTTSIYYQFNFNDFKYIPNVDSSVFTTKYLLNYELMNDYSGKEIIDSASITFYDSDNYNKNNSSLGYFDIPAKYGKNYILRLMLKDLNSKKEVVKIIEIKKSDYLNRHNFYLMAMDGLPLMNNYVSRQTKYKIVYNQLKTKILYGVFFEGFFEAANPPTSNNPQKDIIKLKPDSSFTINLTNGKSEIIEFNRQGFYHFYKDSSKQDGFTIYVHTTAYPFVSTPMQMLMPLRYITTNSEFKKLFSSENKKKSVDDFWLQISSSSARARSMISIYYNRVQQANVLFSADREGWMTDRGMLYIVMGPPERVYKNTGLETWFYGTASKMQTISFNFVEVDNPFTENDFRLDRSTTYYNSWSSAMEVWRR